MKKIALVILALALSVTSAVAQTGPDFPTQTATTTNSSAVIATGNTFQTVLAATTTGPGNNPRHSLTIQNNNTNGDNCWIVVGGVLGSAAKVSAIILSQGQAYTRYYPFIPADAIHATCATSSDTLYIDTQ